MANWIKESTDRMKAKGTQGSFTRIASAHGKEPKEMARTVMAHKEDYDPKTVKKANWLRNVASS